MVTTWCCAFCPDAIPDDGSCGPLSEHYDRNHNPLRPPIPELDLNGPGQDWTARAIAAVRQLAATGEDFTFYRVALIAGEPLSPKSEWGALAQTIEHMGIAKTVSYQQSERPASKGSAVRVWRGVHQSRKKAA